MFLLATQLGMSLFVVVALIFGSGSVFIYLEHCFNPNHGFVIRGLAVNAGFCLSLMLALWFTTGHSAVFMWVIFVTAATTAGTVIGTQLLLMTLSTHSGERI